MATSRESLQRMFDRMKSESGWDPEHEAMRFGYFFIDEDPTKLAVLGEVLEGVGYHVAEIRKDDEGDFYWLHLERVEKHNVDSLVARNEDLEFLATEYDLDAYDGWDVGPAAE